MFFRRIFAGMAFAVAASGMVSADPVLTELRPFKDNLDSTAKVSAPLDPVKGIVEARLFEKGFAGISEGIEIYVPEDQQLCINYVTRNDLYQGSHAFAVAGAPGWVDVAFPRSDYIDTLKRYEAASFIASVLLREKCDALPETGSAQRPLVRIGDTTGGAYLAVVHIDNATAQIVVYARGNNMPVSSEPCTRFPAGTGVAFNATCAIPKETFLANHRAFLTIENDDGSLNRTWVRLMFPDGFRP